MEKLIDDVREIQAIELEILRAVDAFNKENGLRWFLAGGTLLGAIRHGGFIPWDNDIDICMPRPDYEAFIKTFGVHGPYRVMGPEDGNDYIYPFVKVVDTRTRLVERANPMKITGLGLYIDIFPLDGYGNDPDEAARLITAAHREGSHIAYTAGCTEGITLTQKLARLFRKARVALSGGREACFGRLLRKLEAHPFDSSAYIGSTYGVRFEKEIVPREDFAASVPVRFGEDTFPAPVGYDRYLTNMYGDYMTPPPVEKQIANHDMDARRLTEEEHA